MRLVKICPCLLRQPFPYYYESGNSWEFFSWPTSWQVSIYFHQYLLALPAITYLQKRYEHKMKLLIFITLSLLASFCQSPIGMVWIGGRLDKMWVSLSIYLTTITPPHNLWCPRHVDCTNHAIVGLSAKDSLHSLLVVEREPGLQRHTREWWMILEGGSQYRTIDPCIFRLLIDIQVNT